MQLRNNVGMMQLNKHAKPKTQNKVGFGEDLEVKVKVPKAVHDSIIATGKVYKGYTAVTEAPLRWGIRKLGLAGSKADFDTLRDNYVEQYVQGQTGGKGYKLEHIQVNPYGPQGEKIKKQMYNQALRDLSQAKLDQIAAIAPKEIAKAGLAATLVALPAAALMGIKEVRVPINTTFVQNIPVAAEVVPAFEGEMSIKTGGIPKVILGGAEQARQWIARPENAEAAKDLIDHAHQTVAEPVPQMPEGSETYVVGDPIQGLTRSLPGSTPTAAPQATAPAGGDIKAQMKSYTPSNPANLVDTITIQGLQSNQLPPTGAGGFQLPAGQYRIAGPLDCTGSTSTEADGQITGFAANGENYLLTGGAADCKPDGVTFTGPIQLYQYQQGSGQKVTPTFNVGQ